jgi:hypothetical protein
VPKYGAPRQTGGVVNTGNMTAGGHIVGGNLAVNGLSEERLLALLRQSQQGLLEGAHLSIVLV